MTIANKLSNLYCKSVTNRRCLINSEKYGVATSIKEDSKDLKYKLQLLEYVSGYTEYELETQFNCNIKHILNNA